MLLNHSWIADLNKPITIAEVEDEDNSDADVPIINARYDKEVSDWVIGAMETRAQRLKDCKKADPEKPALHAVPLDAVKSPGSNNNNMNYEEKLRLLRLNANSTN